MRRYSAGIGLLAVVLLGLFAIAVRAQDSEIVISLTVPQFMSDTLGDAVSRFEAENPGVHVNVVEAGFGGLDVVPVFKAGLDEHLEDVEAYVSSADVVLANGEVLSVEATRAGYFLDLAPLTSGDPSLNVEDFIPVIWQSYQWDRGVWALPVSADVVILTYDAAAFDAAGLPYPNEAWTLDDLGNAARTLAQRDSSGNVTLPGLMMEGPTASLLFRSLLGTGLYDAGSLPNAPMLVNPALEALLTTWRQLEDEGVVTTQFDENFIEIPMRIEGTFGLGGLPGEENEERAAALLPGGAAGLDVQAFAVSAGTQHPEQAYALAKFLTSAPEAANNPFSATPARQSLVGVEAPAGDGDGPRIIAAFNSPESEAAAAMALGHALPMSELRFTGYISVALEQMRTTEVDAHTALQAAEVQAVTNLQAADERRSTIAVMVSTPVPTPVLNAGEIVLRFGLGGRPFQPNEDAWDQAMADFAASDPEVGQIMMEAEFGPGGLADMAANTDCFYLPYNAVPELDLTTVLNLDPFLDVDATFDRSDVVGNVMTQLQRDNKTWAYPIMIQPEVLRYNREEFAQAGLPSPSEGWTIDSFTDALQALKPTPDDPVPFESRTPGGTYLLMLIAAYGGLPLDYRTNPPTINFTDPAAVDAIRQVLDLVRAGYIDYQELGGPGLIFIAGGGEEQTVPIYSDLLSGLAFIGPEEVTAEEDPYAPTTYPRGSQYTPLSYGIETAYISANTQNAEACYRWISAIARNPELVTGMPARRSMINDPALAGTQGADVAVFYNAFDQLMQDPNAVEFPAPFSGASPANFLLELWLNRVFDSYVAEGGDLEASLAEAQLFAQSYQQCVANVPPFDPATQEQFDYFQQLMRCATQADPSVESLFPRLGD